MYTSKSDPKARLIASSARRNGRYSAKNGASFPAKIDLYPTKRKRSDQWKPLRNGSSKTYKSEGSASSLRMSWNGVFPKLRCIRRSSSTNAVSIPSAGHNQTICLVMRMNNPNRLPWFLTVSRQARVSDGLEPFAVQVCSFPVVHSLSADQQLGLQFAFAGLR